MANHKIDPEILAHLEWIGFVRPTGLVVSAPALVRAGAILDRRDAEGQRLLRECVAERVFEPKDGPVPYLPSFRQFADSVLGWNFSPKGYAGTPEFPIPVELEVSLTDYGETLRPDFAVRELEPKEGASSWQLLVRVIEPGEDFDRVVRSHGQLEASAQGRMERLLRQTGVSAGLIFNGRALRLVSAPRGESSGWLDFRVPDMIQTAGRSISTAMRLLLSQARLLSLPRSQRFAALLEDSRKFQNEVSEKLAEQVLHALYEFLRGFQAAHDRSKGELLKRPLAERPDEVYRALLTIILRLVFLLFAEERDMLPEDEVFLRFYSLSGLYERLREDAALYPDAMDDRYSAWAQLLVLFRMIYDGAVSGPLRLPKRHGVLFDPDRFPFLEGRASATPLQEGERIDPPLVPDGTIYRALEKLLVLDGERISYRALDVEQIGSVYETMMGFRLEAATGRSVAIRADKKQGAPTAVNLEALLAEAADKREKFLQEHADRKLSDTIKKAVVAATTLEDLHAALLPVIDLAASPDLVSKGAMVLQPSEERRRSGSHYTPRSLTEPIVRTTLEPILARLRGEEGWPPRPEQILDLKVCDPAMGSGAFLVETCRQLGDALVEAWHFHGEVPAIPADEDEVIFARRMIAQRCLYGVDKNPVAVDLAKMSLWLVTLAKDHALTFVDHALRCGDSLVGLSRKQIAAFNWNPSVQMSLIEEKIRKTIDTVSNYRKQILAARDDAPYSLLKQKLDVAEEALSLPRQIGDAAVAAFFDAEKPRDRENMRLVLSDQLMKDLKNQGFIEVDGKIDAAIAKLKAGAIGVQPFHWEIEFPEVFERENPGFDGVVGNPPFFKGSNISGSMGLSYLHWLQYAFVGYGGQSDIVALFFRRAFEILRNRSTFGLIATKTISRGDTRTAGLEAIATSNGTIYSAVRRLPWAGDAAVTVSVVWIMKGDRPQQCQIDGEACETITTFLLSKGPNQTPKRLIENSDIAFEGYKYTGEGFLFSELGENCETYQTMQELIQHNPKNSDRIRPLMRGETFLKSPTQIPDRYVIDFENFSEARAREWPDLYEILELRVKPFRSKANRERVREIWWQFGEVRPGLRAASKDKVRLLMRPKISTHHIFGFVPGNVFISAPHVVIVRQDWATFATLQSQVHETWVSVFGAALEDRLCYTPSDCLENFPFPRGNASEPEVAGKQYDEFRKQLAINHSIGLTEIYNHFHDSGEHDSGIEQLRELQAVMDRAVLDAYGWSDIPTACEFLLDFEIDEEEWGNKKKPWHYRWPDEVRDEVLARLLELNAKRAKEEELSGAAAAKKAAKKATPKRAPKKPGMEDLFS
jgi:hypothetical protein